MDRVLVFGTSDGVRFPLGAPSRSDGTGRHIRLRTVWGNPWGFNSLLRHQEDLVLSESAEKEYKKLLAIAKDPFDSKKLIGYCLRSMIKKRGLGF